MDTEILPDNKPVKDKQQEQLEKIDKKIEQLKAQKQAQVKKMKEKERKARTRRLIQYGAIAEKYLECEGMEPEIFDKRFREWVEAAKAAQKL